MAIMTEPAVQQPEYDVVTAQEDNQPTAETSQQDSVLGNGRESYRRGSAEAFRALAARLKGDKNGSFATDPAHVPEIAPFDSVDPGLEVDVVETAPPVAEPQVDQVDYLAPTIDEMQVEYPDPLADAPQAEYLVPQSADPQVENPEPAAE